MVYFVWALVVGVEQFALRGLGYWYMGWAVSGKDVFVRRDGMAGVIREKGVGLYVHIPFCVKKCAYCDFLSGVASEEVRENYVNLICEEIEREAVRYPGYRGETVFFGGGTPTVLRAEQIERILCKLIERFSVNISPAGNGEGGRKQIAGQNKGQRKEAEITLECNPGTVTREDLRKLRKMGINRLSIGLQSAQNEELLRLGRIHSFEDFLKTYGFAREAGFENINVDLMSALPGQSVESYVNSIERVLALRPEHISAYSLMIEEGTPFYERYGMADAQRKRDGVDEKHLLPSEEEERRMYELTERVLGHSGYRRYEISNYALPGYECRHNIKYWKRENYLGFGLGAASLMENCRFTKTGDLGEYIQYHGADGKDREVALKESRGLFPAEKAHREELHGEEQRLSKEEQIEEFMFLGLRLMEGISSREFQKTFQVSIESVYGDVLKKLESQGLLTRKEDRVFLTGRGIDVSNVALAEFLL